MELKEFLQKLIDDEYERYVKEAYEETDRIIKENHDNIYINSDDYYDVVTGICFDEIVKNDKKIYGLEYHETDEFTVYSVVELDPMIAFDDKYEECCDNFKLETLFHNYMIGTPGLHIKTHIKEKNIDGVDYVCYSKPILVETEKTIVVKENN